MRLAGSLNGKQKAIGFILLLPVYLLVGPKFLAFIFYMLLKNHMIDMDMTTLNVLMNLCHSLIIALWGIILLKEFLWENLKAFFQHCFQDIFYALTTGTIMLYVITFIVNVAVTLIFGKIDSSSTNQLLFESYFKHNALLMALQSVFLAPIVEELLFRGLIFRGLEDKSKGLAFLISSLAFGYIHIQSALLSGDWMQLLHLPSYAAMGLGFAIAYEKRGNIIVPVLMHMAHNLIAVILLFAL